MGKIDLTLQIWESSNWKNIFRVTDFEYTFDPAKIWIPNSKIHERRQNWIDLEIKKRM